MNILVVPGHRGLTAGVQLLPLVQKLKSISPELHIDVGYFRDTERVVFEMCPAICNPVRLSNMKTPLKLDYAKHWWRTLRDCLPVCRAMCGYQVIVLLHLNDKHWPVYALARISGTTVLSRETVGVAKRSLLKPFFERLIGHFFSADPRASTLTHWPAIHIPQEGKDYADAFLGQHKRAHRTIVFLNPYRASKQPGWGILQYVGIGKTLREHGICVVLHEKGGRDEKLGFAGIHDRKKVKELSELIADAGIIVAGETSMTQLAALVNAADLVVGDASGPNWLAAALGKATITISPSVECSPASFLPVLDSIRGTPKHLVLIQKESRPLLPDYVAQLSLSAAIRGPKASGDQGADLPFCDEGTAIFDVEQDILTHNRYLVAQSGSAAVMP